MIKKLQIEELQPGMFIVDSGVSWIERPYLYSDNIMATEELIGKLKADGYTEVFVDPAKSRFKIATPDEFDPETPVAGFKSVGLPKPQKPIREEIAAARKTYAAAFSQAKNFMDGIRKGEQVEFEQAVPVVDDMLRSLGRNPDALLGLSKLRDADDYTYTHCVNVAILGMMFAKYLHYSHDQQILVGMAGVFHDLGKALIPKEIINAPRKLTDEEFARIREHPSLGYKLAHGTPGLNQAILAGIHEHHETADGKGYPQGLGAEQINPVARILALADIYDALTSKRAYKDGMPAHKALGIMFQMREEHFYPGFMEHFVRMLGVYPVGSVVLLEDGSTGVVSASNSIFPTKPRVIVVRDPKGRHVLPEEYDLSKDQGTPICRILSEAESGVDPALVLNVASGV